MHQTLFSTADISKQTFVHEHFRVFVLLFSKRHEHKSITSTMRISLNRNVWISSPHIPLCGWCVWSEQTCFCTSTYSHNARQHHGHYTVLQNTTWHFHHNSFQKKHTVIQKHTECPSNILIILRKHERCVFSLPSARTNLTCQPESCQTSRSFNRKNSFPSQTYSICWEVMKKETKFSVLHESDFPWTYGAD